MGWRSFYVYDPDGNTVEFVRNDPTLIASSRQSQTEEHHNDNKS